MKTRLLFSFLLLLITAQQAQAQTLKTTNLNLNAGGKVYDVAFDKINNVYFIVGDFTSIAGVPRKNFAVINASNFNLLGSNPIASMDGVIRSVELIKSFKYVFPVSGGQYVDTLYSLYIGGNFQTINGQSRSYLARISSTYTGQTSTATAFSLDNYDLHIDAVASPTINDGIFDMTTDLSISDQATQSLSFVGKFTISTGLGAPYYTSLNNNDDLYNFARLTHTLTSLQFLSFNLEVGVSSSITSAISPPFTDISYSYEGLMLSEISPTTPVHAKVYELGTSNDQGSVLRTYINASNLNSSGREATVWIDPSGDTTLVVGRFGNNTAYHTSLSQNAAIIDNYSIRDVVGYNGDLYNTLPNVATSIASLGKTNSGTQIIAATNLSAFDNSAYQKKLHCQQDRLFLSDAGLTSVNGIPRVGLAIFCLEPFDSKPFTASDALVCHTEIHTYSIDAVEFADGYRWIYTGSGALYRISGTANAWQPLGTIHLSAANAQSIDIQFPVGSTSGSLSVSPYSVCNTSSDYQYSQGQNLFISVNAMPDISLAPHYTLNCYADTIFMVAQSTMPTVTYSWTYPNSSAPTLNDTILVSQGTNLSANSFYVVQVTNPMSGCFSLDSTYFTTDLIAPAINTNAITTVPTEWTCLTDTMTIYSNIVGATLTWESPSQIGTFYPDPYVITALPSGNLNLYATYLSNGCSAQANWGGIIENQVQAQGQLIGYPAIGGTIVDTLDCSNPTLSLQCDVTAAFSAIASAEWLDGSGGTPTGSNTLLITQADTTGLSPLLTKTFFFRTTNATNGCTAEFGVVVRFDFQQPTVPTLADASFNCSQSTVQLTHPINGNSWINEGWLDGLGAQTGSDVMVATAVGDYYYRVEDTNNGCTNVDTVSVLQTLDLYLDMVSDTLICPDQVVSISPSVIGNTETPSYLWSTGSSASSESAIGGIDTELSVIVTTPSGCVGYDTTTISITAPVVATIVPIGSCEQGNLQVSNVSGGQGNYLYSLDGAPFQTQTAFLNLPFGTYTVSVQDGLGCVYDFTQVLDGATLQPIEMQFAVATYNEQGDTLVLVNLTEFTGLDSVVWEVPTFADVVFEADSVLVLSIPTQGWHNVTLRGYSGICEYSLTKAIYFGDQTPVFDENYLLNGIDSLVISPNPTTNGNFSVNVLFFTAQNYTILVTNNLGQPVPTMSLNTQGIGGTHFFSFPIGSPNGIYRVHVIGDYDARQESILLNQ